MSLCLRRALASLLSLLVLSWSIWTTLPGLALALSIGEERLIGQKILFSVRRELHVLDDPDIHQYINRLGAQVLKVTGPQYFDYRFFIVRSDQFNAFAAPGGMIFFYSGLLEAMQTEDQLVSVMAHEIGHVKSRHIADRVEKNSKVGVASLLLGLAGLALGVPGLSQGILTGSLAAGQTAALRYSREDEEQADRLSFGWMRAMGRDTNEMLGMLRSMRRITRYRSANLPQYLLTHPRPEDRIAYVESLLEMHRKATPGAAPVMQKQADNIDFLRVRSRVLLATGDLVRLRQSCLRSAKNEPQTEQGRMALYTLALIEAENRRFAPALRLMARVQDLYPERAVFKVDQAAILLKADRVSEARTLLADYVQAHPNDMYGVFLLARAESALGNASRAERQLRRVARELPEYPRVFFELGQIRADLGAENEAIFYLGKYYLYQGEEKLAMQNLGRASRDKKLPPDMQEEARKLLEHLAAVKAGT